MSQEITGPVKQNCEALLSLWIQNDMNSEKKTAETQVKLKESKQPETSAEQMEAANV